MNYFKNRTQAVLYVNGLLLNLKPGSQLTMTISPGPYEAFSASHAIVSLSEDTDPLLESGFLATQVNT